MLQFHVLPLYLARPWNKYVKEYLVSFDQFERCRVDKNTGVPISRSNLKVVAIDTILYTVQTHQVYASLPYTIPS